MPHIDNLLESMRLCVLVLVISGMNIELT